MDRLFKNLHKMPRRFTRSNFKLSTHKVPFYKLDRQKTVFDKIRGDYVGPKIFAEEPVLVRAFFDPVPSESQVNKWGFESVTTGEVALFNIDELNELNLKVEAGDVVIHKGKEKEIENTQAIEFFGTTDYSSPMYVFCEIGSVRKSTIRDERADKDLGEEISGSEVVIPANEVIVEDGISTEQFLHPTKQTSVFDLNIEDIVE